MNVSPSVIQPRPVPVEPPRLPRDEGSHPGVKTEWWYTHGHLQDEEGNRYGFHQALFDSPDAVNARYNVDLPAVPGVTQLDSSLTDLSADTHQSLRELHLRRPNSSNGQLAEGRLDSRFESRRGDFVLERTGPDTVRLEAPYPSGRMELNLRQIKGPLMMGGAGEIPMGPNGLSKYYSLPLFEAEGTLTTNGQTRRVSGTTWMDHQWGDMALYDGYRGWDWMGVQLDDGRQMNIFNFRGEDGSAVQTNVGSSLLDGEQTHVNDLEVTPSGSWVSPKTGAAYPMQWHVVVPSQGVDLTVTPRKAEQEVVGWWPYDDSTLAVIPTYWEGACDVAGTVKGEPVSGKAYLEMVGYEEPSGDAYAAAERARDTLASGRVVSVMQENNAIVA